MVGFLATQSEAGLFIVSAVFGLSFSGIIPASVRGSGMGFGGWLSGACVGTPTFSAFPLVESGLALGREKTDHGNKAVKPTSALVRAAEAARVSAPFRISGSGFLPSLKKDRPNWKR